jgi:hypothetical protein
MVWVEVVEVTISLDRPLLSFTPHDVWTEFPVLCDTQFHHIPRAWCGPVNSPTIDGYVSTNNTPREADVSEVANIARCLAHL